MSPPLDRIQGDDRLPESADVVVIGGGVIGVSAAYHLAKKGHSVALVEKGHVGCEQSSRNWGWCRQQGRARAEIPLAREALRLWEEMQIDAGRDAGFRRTGVLFLTKNPAELAAWEKWAEIAREMQVHSTVLTPAEVQERLPGNADTWVGGLHTPSDGRAEPSMAVPALATAARKHGVTIHQACAARGLETAGGRVGGVVTEKGTIRTTSVLLAGGAWSSLFCRRHGIDLPVGLVNATACRTTPAPEITDGALGTDFFCIRRRLDGGLTLALRGRGTVELTPDLIRYARTFLPTYRQRRKGLKISFGKPFLDQLLRGTNWPLDRPSPFEAERVRDPAPDMTLVEEALAALITANPDLKGIQIAEAWGGTIDTTPDTIPVISAVDKLPGFFLATGFSGHGFGIGPGAGRLAADVVTGDAPLIDPGAYSYERLVDGRPLAPVGLF
ncbi:NAD(P)/FAD-dependent oxidoreductase [Phreatobacter cathodiphilus]|uniref:D-amino-acid oxidase n=1 Tax=Phreatobacter cathodiphilus TaxID=1868589 RepID=A0A2S0NCT1_9HYPH|nr:FAD-binding oxidoreductase [Phreatobacter cathodiphilus]AVO45837.1 D-amino-acid oxidase [Phreatobacter cathodiphilus]